MVWFITAAILVLVLMSGAYVFCYACIRTKPLPWLEKDALEKTPYGRFYEHISAGDQWLKDHNAQDLWLDSYDGLRLHALWIPASDAKGTVLLAHGYRSIYLADFGLVFEMYHKLGLNLLIPDQRSHGKSQGKIITFGVKESDDVYQWVQMHNQNLGGYPLLLSGLSMGASTVMYMADRELPPNVCGIIADCGFTSPYDIIAEVYRRTVHLWPAPSLLAADFFARIFGGFSLKGKDSRKCLAHSKLPILMIHGKDDKFVPCRMSEEAYEACTAPKQLLLADNAGHGVSFLHIPEEYTAAVISFLKTNMDGFDN